MPVLIRDDGTQFITRAYRELLLAKKFGFLKREVNLLQQDHGNFACLFVRPDDEIEAVLSYEAGYLLGETVWHFFDEADNLIYCEVLAGGERAVLVVVRQGSVFLDAEISLSQLIEEFSSLFFDETTYDIYVYGDLPIGVEGEAAEFILPADAVKNWTHLDAPVFEQLPQLDSLALLPVSEALKAIGSGLPIPLIIGGVVCVVVIGALAWVLLKPAPKPTVKAVQVVKPVVKPNRPPPPPPDPLAAYKQALVSPVPIDIFRALIRQVQRLYAIPGWKIQGIEASLTGLKVTLVPANPAITAAPLQQWADINQVKVDFTTSNATLYLPISVSNRAKLTHATLQPLLSLGSQLQQRLQTVALPEQVKLGGIESKDGYSQLVITVSFTQVAPDYLLLLGSMVKGWPVVLNGYRLSLQDNLISGSVDFALLGKGT